jgi:DNA recombination protein RmuC
MDPMVFLLFALVLGGLVVLGGLTFWLWSQSNQRMNQLADKLEAGSQAQLSTAQSFGEIQKSLGELGEAGRRMQDLGSEISGLSDLLKAPKLRGGIGELFLGDLLAQMLSPEQYVLQHTFPSGGRVDAVIRLKTGMVPVDSKFPLESFLRFAAEEDDAQKGRYRREFERAVKRHIDSIADSYVRPNEGTFDFALMYIPAENVYYETIIKDEALGDEKSIMAHALSKRVIPVSPNSFYAYLQAIAFGLKGLQIEQQAQEILAYLSTLEGEMGRFAGDFEVLGKHLINAKNKYDEAERKLSRFEEKLTAARQPAARLEQGGQPVLPDEAG